MSRVEADVLLGGRYRLTRRMASGGMGQVWEAEDTVLHRLVAVKVLSEGLSADPTSAERFRREARAAAGLSHPNVAGVFDYGEDDGTQFIVMELVEGETLAERIAREGRLEPAEAARVAAEIAVALEAAHRKGIVHRDVKPGNVMLTPAGEVKVLDFGIAAASGAHLTATGFTMGTAAYLAPEQAAGTEVSGASDVYALGVVLYEMLAGRPPFSGNTPVATAAAHLSQQVPPLTDLVPDVPRHLARAAETALAKDPADRPASAGAFGQMLLEPVIQAGPATPPGRSGGESSSRSEQTTVLPPPTSTAVLPEVEASAGGQPVQPAHRPDGTTQPTATRPARTGAGWRIWAILALVGMVLVAFLLSRVLGGDLSSPRAIKVKVPGVVGLNLAQAKATLDRQGLTVGPVNRVAGRPGTVVRTNPPPGSSVAAGSPVTLYVGAEPVPSSGDGGKGQGKGHDKGKGKGGGGD